MLFRRHSHPVQLSQHLLRTKCKARICGYRRVNKIYIACTKGNSKERENTSGRENQKILEDMLFENEWDFKQWRREGWAFRGREGRSRSRHRGRKISAYAENSKPALGLIYSLSTGVKE